MSIGKKTLDEYAIRSILHGDPQKEKHTSFIHCYVIELLAKDFCFVSLIKGGIKVDTNKHYSDYNLS